MKDQLISIIRKYGFRSGVYDIGYGKVRVQINGVKQLSRWIELIGFSNKKHSDKIRFFIK